MKKILLSVASLALMATTQAQVLNNGFENWETVTVNFAGSPPILPADTFDAFEPVNWSTSNAVSGADSIGGVFFVTQETSNVHSGTSAIKFRTDSIRVPVFGKLTLPGFALNGDFQVGVGSIVGGGDVISPAAVAGAGQPFTTRLGAFKGYYNYAPVFNPNTGSNDTCVVWATLRKGTTIVADAIFKSTQSTGGNYLPFSADFNYVSCETPDTLVVLIASSVPNVQTLVGGSSALVAGSELMVDSLWYTELPVNYSFPPIARIDQDTTTKNTAVVINVTGNDEDCDNALNTLTVAVSNNPANGTATVNGGDITYTPTNNYVGVDSFFYTLNDGTNTTAPTRVRVLVLNTTGIGNVEQIAVSLFPVPANNTLNIRTQYNGTLVANVYDIVGKLVNTTTITSNNGVINTSEMINGIYALQLLNEQGQTVARAKFNVAK